MVNWLTHINPYIYKVWLCKSPWLTPYEQQIFPPRRGTLDLLGTDGAVVHQLPAFGTLRVVTKQWLPKNATETSWFTLW